MMQIAPSADSNGWFADVKFLGNVSITLTSCSHQNDLRSLNQPMGQAAGVGKVLKILTGIVGKLYLLFGATCFHGLFIKLWDRAKILKYYYIVKLFKGQYTRCCMCQSAYAYSNPLSPI